MFGNRRVVVAAAVTHPSQRIVRGRVKEILKTYPFRDGLLPVTLIIEGLRNRERKNRKK
jgi:16S rRNA C1402 (ribose-2'-O) methylase RsmI